MCFRVAYYLVAFAIIVTHEMINPVKGQPTAEVCDNGGSSNSIAAELIVETIHQLNIQLQSIREILTGTVLRKLEAFEQRLLEHDLSSNQTQNSWKLEIAYGIDVGEVPIPSSVVNGWIVLMHRFDGSLNFSRNWSEYKNGFGDIGRGEFWIGNEKIHRLTNRFNYTLRIEIQLNATGQWFYAEYATFSLDSESNKYTLHLSGYSGNAGDALASTSLSETERHNGRGFSTSDVDNDRWSDGNCAQRYPAGWWFDDCFTSCFTCSYQGLFGWHWRGGWQSSGLLRAGRMMIKSI